MSSLPGFFGSRTKLESGRAALAGRLRELAKRIEEMPIEQLAQVYYDCDSSLDEITRLLGLKPPDRYFMWSELRDKRRALDQL